MNASQRTRLTEIMQDDEVLGNKDDFISQVSAVLQESFEKTKGGKTKVQDAQKIAKLAADFHQLGIASVDAEGLLAAILTAQPTLQQLNALFTDKQGGKGGVLAKALEQIGKDREALRTTPDDFGKKIADEIMGGLGGSFERLKGSVETFYQSLGEANEKLLTFSFDKIGNAIDEVSNMSGTARQAATALGALATIGAGTYAFVRFSKIMLGLGGPGAALAGSAAALDGSAAALTRAAIALGAKGVDVPDVPGRKNAGSKVGKMLKTGAKWAWPVAVGYGAYEVGNAAIDAGNKVGSIAAGEYYTPKDDEAVAEMRSQVESLRSQIEGIKARTHPSRANEPNADVSRLESEIADLENRIRSSAQEAGKSVGDGITEGVNANAGKVDAAAQSIMSRIKAIFGIGVDVPVRPTTSPANPTAPAGTAAPGPNKTSGAAPVITNNIRVKTASADPNEIAAAVSRKVGEATAESLRGTFSNSDYA